MEPTITPAPAPQPSTSTLPQTWPGAWGIYKFSRDTIRCNFWLLVEVIVVLFAITLALTLPKTGYVGGLLSDVISIVFSVIIVRILIASVRGHKLSVSDLFKDDLPVLSLKLLGLSLLMALIACLSLLAFIIPAFFVIPRLALCSYFLVDKNMGVSEALNASWQAMHGNVGKYWGIFGVTFCFALLGVTIIGLPFAIYFLLMYSAANAVLYEFLSRQHQTPPTA